MRNENRQNHQADPCSGLHIDDQLRFVCELDGQSGGLGALQHASDIIQSLQGIFNFTATADVEYVELDVQSLCGGLSTRNEAKAAL